MVVLMLLLLLLLMGLLLMVHNERICGAGQRGNGQLLLLLIRAATDH